MGSKQRETTIGGTMLNGGSMRKTLFDDGKVVIFVEKDHGDLPEVKGQIEAPVALLRDSFLNRVAIDLAEWSPRLTGTALVRELSRPEPQPFGHEPQGAAALVAFSGLHIDGQIIDGEFVHSL